MALKVFIMLTRSIIAKDDCTLTVPIPLTTLSSTPVTSLTLQVRTERLWSY